MEEEKVSVPTVVIQIRLQKYSTSKEKQSVTHQYLVTTSRHLALIPGDMEVVIVFKVFNMVQDIITATDAVIHGQLRESLPRILSCLHHAMTLVQ